MPNNPYILPKGIASADNQVASGEQVTIQSSTLENVSSANAQQTASELNRLWTIVNGLADGGGSSRLSGAIAPFTGSVTVSAGNYDTYADAIALYVRQDNARVNFIMPTEAVINNRYPVTFTVLNQGGTGRFTTGFTPTNTVVIDVQGSDTLRRNTSTGTLLNFVEAHQFDLVTVTKTAAGQPWVARVNTLTQGALLLPDGVFDLKSATIRFTPALSTFIISDTITQPVRGDAYRVTNGDDDFGGFGVATDDVMVALVDNPSRLNSLTNDDWLVIRNATNNTITLQELHFLNQITETDTFSDSRLEDRSDVTETLVWLSPFILDHAPFLTPSTDPNNPQAGETDPYVGGRELDGSGYDFRDTSNAPSALVYVRILGTLPDAELSNAFLVVEDRDGNEVSRHNLDTEFRSITLDSSGTALTYLVFDDVGATDNFSSINYLNGQTIKLVYRNTNRSFEMGASVNAIPSIEDGQLPREKLDLNTQALIEADHSITVDQTQKLAGLELTDQTTPLANTFAFYAKLSAGVSTDFSDYHEIEQQNGLLPDYERQATYTILVDPRVQFTQLQKVESTTTKQAVTVVGAVTVDDAGAQRQFIAYTVTLPAITGANSVLDNAWQIDGHLDSSALSGASSTFKVDTDNLSDALRAFIQSQGQSTPATLPEAITQFLRHMTITTDTTSSWTAITPPPIRATLTRQFAAFWDENRRTFSGNYFADLTNVEVAGYAANTIFYYNSPTDPLNTTFPGAQSYIYSDNVRIRNINSGTNISSSQNKIISFNYSLLRTLTSSDNPSMLRIGGSSSTPFMGLAAEEGLYLNIGRGDGGQQSRTYQQAFQVDGGQWHDAVGQTTTAEAEVIIPSNLTGSLTLVIAIQLDNNGNDEGTHEETITITNVGADQTIGQRTFDYTNVDGHSGTVERHVNFVYDHDNNDLSITRRVLFVRPLETFTNAALTYNVRAYHNVTETWNHPTTYARYPINAGNGHDDFGLFDPTRYNTEHVNERNRVLLSVQNYRDGDTSSDPELAVRVVVDGEDESTQVIRLHRPKSDFDFADMNFGNSICAVAHIQCYDYTGDSPSQQELQTLYSGQASWLNAFYPPGHAVDRITIDANLELSSGHSIIMTDDNDNTRKSIEISEGSILIKTV